MLDTHVPRLSASNWRHEPHLSSCLQLRWPLLQQLQLIHRLETFVFTLGNHISIVITVMIVSITFIWTRRVYVTAGAVAVAGRWR